MNTTTQCRPDLATLQPASSPSVAEQIRADRIFLAIAAAAGLVLFWPTLAGLWSQWMEDSDFSHGIVVVAISGALLYNRRHELGALPARRSLAGLGVLLLCLLLHAVGLRTVTRIIERLTMWGALVGSVWLLYGGRVVWSRPFPYLYLLLCIPPPFFLLNPVRLALKNFATRLSADALIVLGVPATPEGNVLAIGECRLEVADACSGIRSLMAVTATGILLAYLLRMGVWKGTLLTALAVPITVLVNVLRLVVVAVALTSFDIDLTSGWQHDMVGFAVFGISLTLLFVTSRFVEWFFTWAPNRKEATRP